MDTDDGKEQAELTESDKDSYFGNSNILFWLDLVLCTHTEIMVVQFK